MIHPVRRLLSEVRYMLTAHTHLARSKLQAWGLPMAVVIAFLLTEFVVGNLLTIAVGYVTLTFFIFTYGLIENSTPVRRGATFFLGLAVLCFGNGRVLYWFYDGKVTDNYEWLFDMGHISLWVSAVLTVVDLRERRDVIACDPLKQGGAE